MGCVVTDHTQMYMTNINACEHTQTCTHTCPHSLGGADAGKKQHPKRDGNSYSGNLHELPLEWVGFHGNSLLSSPQTLQGQLPRLLQLRGQGSPSCQSPESTPIPTLGPKPRRTLPQGVSCHTQGPPYPTLV